MLPPTCCRVEDDGGASGTWLDIVPVGTTVGRPTQVLLKELRPCSVAGARALDEI